MGEKFDAYKKAEDNLESSLQDGIEILERVIGDSEAMLRFHDWKWEDLKNLRTILMQARDGMQTLQQVAFPPDIQKELDEASGIHG